MEKQIVREIKDKISKEAEHIVGYVSGFDSHSAKDEQALAEILSMLTGISTAIVKIEDSHQRRIKLSRELESTLSEMETDSKKFADKYGKKVSS